MNLRPLHPLRTAISVLVLLAGANGAGAQSAEQARAELADWSVPKLQSAYLECDRLASHTALDSGTAAVCSTISEVTLRRAFDGDFARLLDWWRAARDPRLAQGMRAD